MAPRDKTAEMIELPAALAVSAIRLQLLQSDDSRTHKPYLVPISQVRTWESLLAALDTLYSLKTAPASISLGGHTEIHPAFWGLEVICPGATYVVVPAAEMERVKSSPKKTSTQVKASLHTTPIKLIKPVQQDKSTSKLRSVIQPQAQKPDVLKPPRMVIYDYEEFTEENATGEEEKPKTRRSASDKFEEFGKVQQEILAGKNGLRTKKSTRTAEDSISNGSVMSKTGPPMMADLLEKKRGNNHESATGAPGQPTTTEKGHHLSKGDSKYPLNRRSQAENSESDATRPVVGERKESPEPRSTSTMSGALPNSMSTLPEPKSKNGGSKQHFSPGSVEDYLSKKRADQFEPSKSAVKKNSHRLGQYSMPLLNGHAQRSSFAERQAEPAASLSTPGNSKSPAIEDPEVTRTLEKYERIQKEVERQKRARMEMAEPESLPLAFREAMEAMVDHPSNKIKLLLKINVHCEYFNESFKWHANVTLNRSMTAIELQEMVEKRVHDSLLTGEHPSYEGKEWGNLVCTGTVTTQADGRHIEGYDTLPECWLENGDVLNCAVLVDWDGDVEGAATE